MENVLLVILLLIALALIGIVLMQRSEGGGLGMGGGGGGGVMSGRAAATAMTKLTWILGASFMAISLALTIVSAQNSAGSSVLDRIGGASAPEATPDVAPTLDGDALLPPSLDSNAPVVPPAD